VRGREQQYSSLTGQNGRRTGQEERDKGKGLGCAMVLREASLGGWRGFKRGDGRAAR
jgi:hypothetical protein